MILLPNVVTPLQAGEQLLEAQNLFTALSQRVGTDSLLNWLVEFTFGVGSVAQIYDFMQPVQTNMDVPLVIYKNNNATWTDPYTGITYFAKDGEWVSEEGGHPIQDRERIMDNQKAAVMGPNATDSGAGMFGGLF